MCPHDAREFPRPFPALRAADFCGIPFRPFGRTRDGVDCYGLLYLVYREAFGIHLPSYVGHYASLNDPVLPLLIQRGARTGWIEIPKKESTGCGDALIIRLHGQAQHVGIAIDARQFLHCDVGQNVTRESVSATMWEKRIVARFRWGGWRPDPGEKRAA